MNINIEFIRENILHIVIPAILGAIIGYLLSGINRRKK